MATLTIVTPAQRITAIKESAALLAPQDWSEIDLILRQYGIPTTSEWQTDDRYGYVVQMIDAQSDEKLHAIHQYLVGESGDVPVGPQPWSQGKFKLFMSHLAVHESFVCMVKTCLNKYGVSSFVAHVSIEPSTEWQSVVESALRSCDAMAVFLHKDFHNSNWCDQEVGFALARRVPVLPIAIEINPYGFMGKLQAARCQPSDTPLQVADKMLKWLRRTPSAQTAMTEGLVTAFERSGYFSDTRLIFGLLQEMPIFTPIELQRLETAVKDNSQVRDAVLGPDTIPDLIHKLIVQRGGNPSNSEPKQNGEVPF
jgi:hypothetical protein